LLRGVVEQFDATSDSADLQAARSVLATLHPASA